MLKIIDKDYLKNKDFCEDYEEIVDKNIMVYDDYLAIDDTTKDTYTRILESGHIGITYEGWTQYDTIFDKLYDLIVAGKIVKVDYEKGMEEIQDYFNK